MEKDSAYFDSILVQTFEHFKIPTPGLESRSLLYGSGKAYPKLMQEWGISDILGFWQIFDKKDFEQRKEKVLRGECNLVDGVLDTLRYLQSHGYIMAILSNSNQPITTFNLKHFQIDSFFSEIKALSPNKEPEECKPEIGGMEFILQQLHYTHDRDLVWFIGDSYTDVVTAKRANVHGIFFDINHTKSPPPMEIRDSDFITIHQIPELLSVIPNQNPFGYWYKDEFAMPAFVYQMDQFKSPLAPTFTTYGTSIDHFHQIGNSAWMATVHNGGYVQVMDSGRGFMWLTFKAEKPETCEGGGITFLFQDNHKFSDLYTATNPPVDGGRNRYIRVFGQNYFEKRALLGTIETTHRIIMPFEDSPFLISKIIVKNPTTSTQKFRIIDYWGIYVYYLLRSLVVIFNNRHRFSKSRTLNLIGNLVKGTQKLFGWDTDSNRRKFARKINYHAFQDSTMALFGFELSYTFKTPYRLNRPSPYAPELKSIAMFPLLSGNYVIGFHRNLADSGDSSQGNISDPALWIGYDVELAPGDSKTFYAGFGYEEKKNLPQLVKKAQSYLDKTNFEVDNAQQLVSHSIDFSVNQYPWVQREVLWHSAYLWSGIYRDDFTNLHKLPQGSIYAYGHGFDGSIRDYALYLPAVLHLSPQFGREFVIYTLSLMRANGSLLYGVTGYGGTMGGVHNRASDLYLFVIWMICEYVYTTRDFTILQMEIPYYPCIEKDRLKQEPLHEKGTVLDRIDKALTFLFSGQVGIGAHGMIKVNDGDWSDGITFLVPNRGKFVKDGESAFNTAMALYVLPLVLPLIKEHLVKWKSPIEQSIAKLKVAMDKAWNGHWFYRGYDGLDHPIGNDALFLEHHPWYIISQFIASNRINPLFSALQEKLEDVSPIGPVILNPPQRSKLSLFPPGWDVNGGIWHAINSLLTWAYSLYDEGRAWQNFQKCSMYTREQCYPHLWYGIWTGPDSYNAPNAERAGEAFYHIPTPMTDYPAQNMNLHACFLMAALRLVGFQPNFEGFDLYLNFSHKYHFKTSILETSYTQTNFSVKYYPPNQKSDLKLNLFGKLVPSLKLKKIHGAEIKLNQHAPDHIVLLITKFIENSIQIEFDIQS